MPAVGRGQSQSVSELIALCDADGALRFVSRTFAAFFGASVEQWLGRDFAPGGASATPGLPASYRTRVEIRGRERVIAWVETVLAGGERLYVGRPEDAAPTDARDTTSDAGDARLKFLATMSHEMRTPLNGIIGMNGLLLNTALEPNQRAYAESVRESSAALLALINDLLDYAKIDAGRMDLDEAPFCPKLLLQNVAELLSPRASEKGIEIAAYIDERIPARLLGDEARLRQVLINLAGNGVKFTDAGGVLIEARLCALDDGTARIRVNVRDTGIGIPEDIQMNIFDEFSQAHDDTAKRNEGTGLGLSIASKLVAAMGGKIELESAPGEGSLFSFEIELRHQGAPAARAPIHTPAVVATRSRMLGRSLRMQLETLGVQRVVVAESAEATRLALAAETNAVLLCDIYLAGDGAALGLENAGRAIVLLSPLARDRLEDLKHEGFENYLIKPIRQASLLEQFRRETAASREADPVQRAPSADATTAEEPESEDKPANAFRLLLAEDNQINAVLATTILKRAGHKVDVASNGAEALDALRRSDYDMIFMDMHMPDVDGLEATRSIRALSGAKARVPIVALTANAMGSEERKCLNAGMDDFLSKPFEPGDLAGMVDKWAGRESAFSKAS